MTSKNTLIEYESKKKAEDFDVLMEKIKEKRNIPGKTRFEKIQLLTLIPDSWSRNAIVNYLNYFLVLPEGRCFLAAWDVSTSVIAFKHDRPKFNLPKRKSIHSFRCSTRIC